MKVTRLKKPNLNLANRLDAVGRFMADVIVLSFGSGRSLPGEPPCIKTGALAASIGYTVTDTSCVIGSGEGGKNPVPYALSLELGTHRVAPRPYLRPALYDNFDNIMKEFANAK